MTPLEKAVEAGEARHMTSEIGGWVGRITPDDARAIIRAFLEAAAEDDELCRKAYFAICAMQPGPPVSEFGKAAILALKETING